MHGAHLGHDRALAVQGAHHERDRAFDRHSVLPAQDRASSMDGGAARLYDKGPLGFCHLPRHSKGGGGAGEGLRPIHQ